MPKLHLERSIEIDAPVEKVYTTVNDLHQWKGWSPWLILEPETEVKVAEDGKFYEWEGKRIGSGNMKITGESENQSVDYDLTFLKPWKSFAKVKFELKPSGAATKVIWHMDTSLPFFMFWMKSMMEAWIGMDFERGLALLKDYVEDGEAHSKMSYDGVSTFQGITYVGLRTTCPISEIGPNMSSDFDKLSQFMKGQEDNMAGYPVSIYHKWDLAKKRVDYTVGFPVKTVPTLSNGFIPGEIPTTQVYTTTHIGPYHHLGNAWSAMMNLGRSKVFAQNKKIAPFEVYVSDPSQVAANELVTEIKFPVK